MTSVEYNADRTITVKVDVEIMNVIADINRIVRERGYYGCDYTILKRYAPTWIREEPYEDGEPSNHINCQGIKQFNITDRLIVIGNVTEEDGPNEYCVDKCDMVIHGIRFNLIDTVCVDDGTVYKVGDWLRIILE